jgi:hypothetical protein
VAPFFEHDSATLFAMNDLVLVERVARGSAVFVWLYAMSFGHVFDDEDTTIITILTN